MRRFFVIAILFLFPLCAIGAEECLECHDKYQKANHGKLDCVACHTDTRELPHGEKLLKPGCASCHKEPVKHHNVSVHAQKGLACKDCHNVHAPALETKKCAACHPSVAHKTLPSARKHMTEMECTGCHAKSVEGRILVRLDPGKQLIKKDHVDRNADGFVDEKEWSAFLADDWSTTRSTLKMERNYIIKGSAHNIGTKAISCNSCHVDHQVFRKATLEVQGAFPLSLPLEPQSAIPRLPMRELYKLTPHGKEGVKCQDCHTSQKHISDAVCVKCHSEVNYVYKGTIHGKKAATTCTDCHNPHEVKAYRELSPQQRISVCARCHKDYKEKHRWLPHTQLHFMYLECSTCHSPRSARSMVFTVNVKTKSGERKLDHDDIVSVFGHKGVTRDLIDINGDNRVVSSELAAFFTALQNGIKEDVFIRGSIVVTEVFHDYSQIQKREKVCTTCHSDDAPFYDSMYLVLPEMGGISYMPVRGTVLSALPSSLVVNVFLLGETKMNWNDIKGFLKARGEARREMTSELGFKWIDFFGIFLSLAALLFVCIHIIMRVVFKR